MRALIELWRWSSSGADGLAPASWCTFTLSILRSVFSGSHGSDRNVVTQNLTTFRGVRQLAHPI